MLFSSSLFLRQQAFARLMLGGVLLRLALMDGDVDWFLSPKILLDGLGDFTLISVRGILSTGQEIYLVSKAYLSCTAKLTGDLFAFRMHSHTPRGN